MLNIKDSMSSDDFGRIANYNTQLFLWILFGENTKMMNEMKKMEESSRTEN